jgi:hypothetical protein
LFCDKLRTSRLNVCRNERLNLFNRRPFEHGEILSLATNGVENVTKRRCILFANLPDKDHNLPINVEANRSEEGAAPAPQGTCPT